MSFPTDEGDRIWLLVRKGKTLHGHLGYRFVNRMILRSDVFHELHKAQMDSDFDTMRRIFKECIDMCDMGSLTTQQIQLRLLGL